jgi:hypothetical protein
MLKILAAPWELIKSLFYLAFPMARGSQPAARAGEAAGVWIARGILVFVALLGLAALNQWELLGLRRLIPYPTINRFWLPAIAFCVYAMIWLGWWLYRLLNLDVPQEQSDYPDIDRAWKQAVEALTAAGIGVDSTPLFLVLGGSLSGEESMFQSAGIRAQVKQVPRDPSEPVHVTANHDAIWVSCRGASVLSQQLMAQGAGAGGPAEVSLETLSGPESDPFKTAGIGGEGTLRIEDFLASPEFKKAQSQIQSGSKPRTAIDIERYAARLRYLCRLIARDRMGLCPVNGILVVIPVTAADPGSPLADIATASKADLTDALEAMRQRCPVLFLVSDLDRLEGFTELAERLPTDQRSKRMGQRFPLVPDLEPQEVPTRVKESVAWIGSTLFPTMVHSLFQVESNEGDVDEVVRANSELYRFLAAMRERRERLSQLMRDSIPSLPEEPILYRGCYLAGTGLDSSSQQAFAPGVLRLLIREQDSVTWTANALRQDATSMRVARTLRAVLILGISLGVLLILGLIAWKVFFASPEELDV